MTSQQSINTGSIITTSNSDFGSMNVLVLVTSNLPIEFSSAKFEVLKLLLFRLTEGSSRKRLTSTATVATPTTRKTMTASSSFKSWGKI